MEAEMIGILNHLNGDENSMRKTNIMKHTEQPSEFCFGVLKKRDLTWPSGGHILFVDKGQVLGLREMVTKREAALIVIIIIYITIICWSIGISFYSWSDKMELIRKGVWVCAGDGNGRNQMFEGIRGIDIVRKKRGY